MTNILSGPLVSDRIVATGGRSTGFDYLRFLLSISVILFHTIITSYGLEAQRQATRSPLGFLLEAILPMFFALSGFLVAGSLERAKSIAVFLGLRVLRIFPALAVDTLFCALILGPLLTTFALTSYFTDGMFWSYFLNILGIIHFNLPGVFETNPVRAVNGQLWTIPLELECYIALTVLALFGFHKRRMWMLAACVGLTALLEIRVLLGMSDAWSGRLLPLCFLFGVVCFLFRDYVRLTVPMFLMALVAGYFCLRIDELSYLGAIPLTYITVYLGLFNPRKSTLLESGDYSYGLFLYGFPIQQALMAILPSAREWYWNALLAVPVALAFSVISWHLVEKRVLARKPLLFAAHAKWESFLARRLGRA